MSQMQQAFADRRGKRGEYPGHRKIVDFLKRRCYNPPHLKRGTYFMYKQIYIPVDNSDHSNMAIDIGILLAKQFGAKVVGSHAYAAKLHDRRFKQMEAGLPEEYHDEKELGRQRKIHDSLITRGLEIITDSYLDVIDSKCKESNLPLERRSLEGKNYK